MFLAIVLFGISLVALHMGMRSFFNHGGGSGRNSTVFIISICSAVWNSGHALMIIAGTAEEARLSIGISKIGVIFMLPFITKYILDAAGTFSEYSRKVFYGFLVFAAFFAAFCFFSDTITIVEESGRFNYFSKLNTMYVLYILYCLLTIVTDVALLVILMRKAQFKREAFQAKFLLGTFGTVALMTAIGFSGILHFPLGCLYQFCIVVIIFYFSKNYDAVSVTSSNLLDYMYTYVSTPVIVISHLNKVLLSNKSAVSFFNIGNDGLIGKDIAELFDFDNLSQEFCKSKVVDASKTDCFDALCLTNNIKCNISANYIYDRFSEIVCTVFVITDLTDTINLIDQLNEARQAAETENDAKSAFLANMSHEIRTPMNAIIGMSDILLQRDLDKDIKNYVLSIRSSGNGLLTIINDILDLSKIESGKFDIINSEYMLPSLIVDVVNIIFIRLEEKPIYFLVNINPTLPAFVIGDEMRIKQILINILSNAVKFTEKGFIRLDVDGEYLENQLVLSFKVSDSGIGIRKQEQDKLFGLFSRVDTRKNRAILGTGLGLSISKNLAELMNGSIGVESEYGVGTTFTVKVTQIVIRDTPIAVIKNKEALRIVVFEPEEVVSESVKKTLSQFEVDFVALTTEEELVREMNQNKITHLITSTRVLDIVEKVFENQDFETSIIVLRNANENIGQTIKHREIYLPLSCIQIADILNNSEAFERPSQYREVVVVPMPYAHILVVDDNIVNLEVAKGLMAPYQMKIDTAISGYEAIDKIKTTDYDLVFMDHMMPVMDGVDATKEIRKMDNEKYKDLTIVALTANALSDAKDMFLSEGLNDFMAKPIELTSLNRILKTWILEKHKDNGGDVSPADNNIEVTANEVTENSAKENDVKEDGIKENDSKENDVSAVNDVKEDDISAVNDVKENDMSAAKSDESIIEYMVCDVDFNTGKNLLGGNISVYNKILKTYYDDSVSKQTTIAKALEDNDIKLFTTHIHALKSASASIGAKELSVVCERLEAAGRNGDLAFINRNLDTFKKMSLSVIADIDGYLRNFDMFNDDVSAEKTVSVLDKELLERLKTACEFYSSKEITNIMSTINQSLYDEPTSATLKIIQEKIDIFEFEEAVEGIDILLKA